MNFSSTKPGVTRLLVGYVFLSTVLASTSTCFARPAAPASDASLLNPIYQPLPTGAGPQTNDKRDGQEALDTGSSLDLAKTNTDLTNEEIADLWDAALANSQDIQFIIQKLSPKKESIKSGGVVKDLSHALCSCVLAGEGLTGTVNQSSGTQMIINVLTDQKSKSDKQAAIKESDAVMLYKMIRDTGRKLTNNFYNYKKFMNVLDRANLDMIDLTAMVTNTRDKLEANQKVELEYLLRKQQRDIETVKNSMDRCHRELITLCGKAAVDKLDVQLAENISLSRRTATRVTRPVFTQPDKTVNRE